MSLIKILSSHSSNEQSTRNAITKRTTNGDIDSICDDFFYSNYNGDISEAEELVRILCDAVCKNFPTN